MKYKLLPYNDEHVRNAMQFLEDLKTAKKAIKEFDRFNEHYYETPDWLQNQYNHSMQNLGRWLVKNNIV